MGDILGWWGEKVLIRRQELNCPDFVSDLGDTSGIEDDEVMRSCKSGEGINVALGPGATEQPSGA